MHSSCGIESLPITEGDEQMEIRLIERHKFNLIQAIWHTIMPKNDSPKRVNRAHKRVVFVVDELCVSLS
jgi:hypothetical protein